MSIADLTQAKLARSMWDRYKQSYLPILEGLTSDLASGKRLEDSLALVPEQTESAFNLQQANQTSQLERIGVDSAPSQSALKQTELSKAKAQAGAENELRLFNRDLREQSILGASGSMASQLQGGN